VAVMVGSIRRLNCGTYQPFGRTSTAQETYDVLVVRREHTVAHTSGEWNLVPVVRVDWSRREDTRGASLKFDLSRLVQNPIEDVLSSSSAEEFNSS
jgi:hypothetical protein